MKSNYKKEFPKKERIHNSSKLIEQNKGQVPVICEKDPNSKMKAIYKTKYLVKRELTVDKFIAVIRNKLELEINDALFIFVYNKEGKTALITSMNFGDLYDKYKDDDGFLYMMYTNEKVWG